VKANKISIEFLYGRHAQRQGERIAAAAAAAHVAAAPEPALG
jgi:hypothetical protein